VRPRRHRTWEPGPSTSPLDGTCTLGPARHAWGRWASLQVYVWIATGMSAIVITASALGFRFDSSHAVLPRPVIAIVFGALIVPVLWLVGLLVPAQFEGKITLAALLVALVTFAVSVGISRGHRSAV
jgi:hypothetical protein